MRKHLLPVVVVSLGVFAVSCGDDDDEGDSGSDTTSVATSAATDTTAAIDTTAAPATTGAPATSGAATDCALDEPLKIGFAADLGELGAFSDGPGSQAAQVKVDQLNAAGGVGGQQIEYVIKDIQGDPAATQRAAQELLDDGVHAIIGPPFSSTGAPLLDTVDGQVPVISMASTDVSLADPSRGAFLTSFSDAVQSSAMAEVALGRDLTTAVTFSSGDDVYFSGNPEFFKEAFEQGGGTVVQDFSFSLADADFSTQVNEIAALDEPPQALFTAMVMPQTQTLLEQLDGAGLGDIVVLGVDGFDATVVWSAGEVADGVLFAAHTFPQEGNDVQAFLDDAAAAGAEIETISFGALAADTVQIIVAAVTEACSLDGATLITTIDGLVDVPVTTGSVTYAGAGGVPEKDVVVLGVEGGQPVFEEALRPAFISGA